MVSRPNLCIEIDKFSFEGAVETRFNLVFVKIILTSEVNFYLVCWVTNRWMAAVCSSRESGPLGSASSDRKDGHS